MLAADLPVEPMMLSTYSLQDQSVVVGAPPLSTLGTRYPKWLNELSPRMDWESSWAELDAINNTISTVHRGSSTNQAKAEEPANAGMTANSMIVRAQSVIGLSLKDLATVYGVSRQTLYNYKKQTDQPSDVNWSRLQQVDKQVAELELVLPASPGALAKRFANEQGETLLSMLQQDDPDVEQLKVLATQLAAQIRSAAPAGQHQITLDGLTRHS